MSAAIISLARTCGDDVSEARPILDVRLEDGSRVAAMLPLCAVDGPTLTRLAHCVLTANVALPHHSTREALAMVIDVVTSLGSRAAAS